MTLTGAHIYRKERNCSKKSFIPWSKESTPPPAFLKRGKETQAEKSREFLESILDHNLEPNFRPKQPCKCPKLAKLANSQLAKELNLQTVTTSDNRETANDNIPTVNDNISLTVRNMEAQAPKQPRPQRPYRKIDQTGVILKMEKMIRQEEILLIFLQHKI